MTPIRHIVFDIGKVLIHYDPSLPYQKLIADLKRREWFLEQVCSPDWNIEQDRGRSWEDAEAQLIGVYPDEAENIRSFRRHWHEMVPFAYDDTVEILRRLIDDQYDVTMLTNFAADTFAEARDRFEFFSWPRGVTVSGEVGLIKPDERIYSLHAKTFSLEPAATLFIDDSSPNVDGAIKAGWQAIQFRGAEGLQHDLLRLGVLRDRG